jgi:16S rRNA pseudouridine516 synthase
MAINTKRLDRLLSEFHQINRKKVRLILAQQRVTVDGVLASDIAQIVDRFSVVVMDGKVVQANKPYYIMLNKPVGVVCATKDDKHKTVIDLLSGQFEQEIIESLHIVGRLDLNTSGLVLLTNDSRWSEQLTSPEHKIAKCYQVTLANPITSEYISAFAQGMYFNFEKITTRPAILRILSATEAEVILTEGRYHQIKRMFGRFRNPVVALHRHSIGKLCLDESLNSGQIRTLNALEVSNINN